MRLRTRIVCTLATPRAGGGRPQDAPRHVAELVRAGMDVARINLSHAQGAADFASGRAPRYDLEEGLVDAVRRAAAEDGPERHVGVLLDVQGIKVRMHLPAPLRVEGLGIVPGQTLRMRITRERTEDELTCDGPPLLRDAVERALAERGPLEVAVGDGDPILLATGIEGDAVLLLAPEEGRLAEGRGVTFRSVRPEAQPPLTEKDRVDLAAFVVPALLEGRADACALSFVQCGADVRRLREFCATAVAYFRDGAVPEQDDDAALLERLAALRPDLAARYAEGELALHVVAKIETAAAVERIDGILREADGIMVARGDLGLHCPPEDVPRHQKELVARARLSGRAAIVATQMLHSLEHAPEPRRSEAADVFNAVLDGADALMLSGETATGARPRRAVEILARIAAAAERWETGDFHDRRTRLEECFLRVARLRERVERELGDGMDVTDRVTFEVVRLAESLGARAIVAATRSGQTARHIARFDPSLPLLAVVPDAAVARRLALVGSVLPVVAPAETGEDALSRGLARAVEVGLLATGDRIVVASARPEDPPGVTTTLGVRIV